MELSWYSQTEIDNTTDFYMTMTINNIPTAGFSPGETGIWMGIGYRGLMMTYQDIILCYVTFTGVASSDHFVCQDRYTVNTKSEPLIDTQ